MLNILVITESASDKTGLGILSKNFIETLLNLSQKELIRVDIYAKNNIPKVDKFDITITLAPPSIFYKMLKEDPNLFKIYKECKRNIFNIIFETDILPALFDIYLESLEFIHEYMVQSKFMEDILRERTDKPIHYIPVYFNETEYIETPIEDRLQEEIFKVFMIGQLTTRKGLTDGLISFVRELGNKEDCELVIKYHHTSNFDYRETIFDTIVKTNQIPDNLKANIEVISDMLPYSTIKKIHGRSSLLLFTSRGEGFGIPAVEAQLIGTPVIYTNWSSLPEVAGLSKSNYPVDYILDEAQGMIHYGYDIGTKYAIPLISSIMGQLRLAYNNWKENRKMYYQSSRDIMINNFGVEKSLERTKNLIFQTTPEE